MRRATAGRLAAPLLAATIACVAAACGKSAPPVAADAASAPADACEKVKARIARCKAHIKQGSFEMKFDEGATSSPELCQQADKMMDGVARMSGCEST